MKLPGVMLAAASACIAVFSVLFFSCGAIAEYTSSANDVMKGCRSHIEKSSNPPIFFGVCLGAVDAIVDVGAGVCAPKGSTLDQAVRIVAAYIEARPARLHENFNKLALEALRDAWPCGGNR